MVLPLLLLLVPAVLAQNCTLLDAPPQAAYPSLTKCYKYNKNTCCNAGNDAYIKGQLATLMPDSCQTIYDELVSYFCYGCYSRESSFIGTSIVPTLNTTNNKTYNVTKQYIYVCQSYLEALWGGDITQPSQRFDNCGFTTYWLNAPND